MLAIKFTRKIPMKEPIDVYNHGKMPRYFTYVNDLLRALALLLKQAPNQTPIADLADSPSPFAHFRLVNIGNSKPLIIICLVAELEEQVASSHCKI